MFPKMDQKKGDAACFGKVLRHSLVSIALALLFLVPASALLGGGDAKSDSPVFLVAWGGDGGIPAIALCGALKGGAGEAVVLLPGCASSAGVLRVTLRNEGMETLETLFLPTVSPYPRGVKALLKECPVRRIVVAEDSRSRGDWQSVIQEAIETGSSLERLQPDEERQWTTTFEDWRYLFRRLPDGENEGVLSAGKDGCRYVFRNLETGEFVLERQAGEIVTRLLELPRISRPGTTKIPLSR